MDRMLISYPDVTIPKYKIARVGNDIYCGFEKCKNITGSLDNPFQTEYDYSILLFGSVDGERVSIYQSGWSVSSAGDVNGDGIADLLIGAYKSDPAGGVDAGRSYVVFGKTGSFTAIDLSAIATGNGGFVINGQGASDYSGYSVSSAGDVNGDGFADLIVGAASSDPAVGIDAGRTYVVYGKTNSTAINLSDIATGNGGFVINGQCSCDNSGVSVSSAGSEYECLPLPGKTSHQVPPLPLRIPENIYKFH